MICSRVCGGSQQCLHRLPNSTRKIEEYVHSTSLSAVWKTLQQMTQRELLRWALKSRLVPWWCLHRDQLRLQNEVRVPWLPCVSLASKKNLRTLSLSLPSLHRFEFHSVRYSRQDLTIDNL